MTVYYSSAIHKPTNVSHHLLPPVFCQMRGVADKSLARPGRKQATETKLGIYSTHSIRSSTHFLVRCSNFCKSIKKKKPEGCPSNQVSAAGMTSALDDLSIVFPVQGTGGSPTGPNLEYRVSDQDSTLLIDYLRKGQTVNAEYYSSLLVQL